MRFFADLPDMKIGILLFLCLSPVALADWPQWLGPHRNNYQPDSPPMLEALPADGLKPLWKSETFKSGFEGGWSSPVIANGTVYLFTHYRALKKDMKLPKRNYPWLAPDKRGHLSPKEYQEYEVNRRDEDEALGKYYTFIERTYAFDAKTGETKWTNDKQSLFTRFLQSGTITVDREKLYVMGAPRTMRCIDAKTSESVWDTRLPGDHRDEFFMSSPAINDHVMAVFANELYGIDIRTGTIIWSKPEYKNTHSSPTSFKNCFIVNRGDGHTACLDAKTGEERWSIETGARMSTPVIRNDLLVTYGSSRKGGVRAYRISPEGGKELWRNTESADPGASPTLIEDHLYVMGERQLSCISLKDGERAWKEMLPFEKPRYTSISGADGKLFYPWDGLLILSANAQSYTPLIHGKINAEGTLNTREGHWNAMGLQKATDQEKAKQTFRQQVDKQGPVNCTNAAISDGKIFLRRKDHVVCYDLRK